MFGHPPSIERSTPWSSVELSQSWGELTARAERQLHRGARSSGFEVVLDHARKLLWSDKADDLAAAMQDRRFCRAVVMLWTEDHELVQRSLRIHTLKCLQSGAAPLSRLTLSSLLGIHLRHFAHLNLWEAGLFDDLTATIASGIQGLSQRSDRDDIVESTRESPEWFLDASGPETVARILVSGGHKLADFLAAAGLRGFDGGDYGEQVRLWYYIEQIRSADPTADHDFLNELTQVSVYKAPISDGLFGHRVLEAMASKDQKPSTTWLNTILTIAGDPRLEHSQQWFEWWKPIAPQAMANVKAWLSAQDLRLFLAAVEEYGIREDDHEIQRMFPDRKFFLEGLLALGIIKETRLILGKDARRYVVERLGTNLRSDVATLRGESQRSVIYVDCGTFHLVEGSHSFKIWTYVGVPSPLLTNRAKRVFTGDELRKGVPDTFLEQNNWEYTKFDGYAHHHSENGTWQFKVIDFLAGNGIRLPHKKLVTGTAISNYARRYGLPSA